MEIDALSIPFGETDDGPESPPDALCRSAGLLGAGSLSRAFAADQGSPKKILFFTKSSRFIHPVVQRKRGQPGLGRTKILTAIGKEHGFEVHATKDGREFEPDKIGQWDGFVFETTGDPDRPRRRQDPADVEGRQSRLPRRDPPGQGFVGMHLRHRHVPWTQGGSARSYIEMIGGEFIVHGDQQKSRLVVVDPDFRGPSWLGSSFEILDEWYCLAKNLRDDLHVIIVQDTERMEKTKGSNKAYDRPNFP